LLSQPVIWMVDCRLVLYLIKIKTRIALMNWYRLS
jgi:hypothetical protein